MKRRDFLRNTAAATSAFYIVPSHVLGKWHVPPSDTLYVAAIGVGGRGGNLVSQLAGSKRVKLVALCDVDDVRARESYKNNPDAATYRDFRKLYDEKLASIDAICVGTPDHTHATIALPFMLQGKHAYVEKPLTHNISEARMMAEVARDKKLITQMGNQGSSGVGIEIAKEAMSQGVIGDVYKVDCWTNRPVWPQGFLKYREEMPVPDTLDWDLWLGPAPYRPYNENYLPFKWRAWWDFGTGALGDMGCHILETPFNALKLGSPKTISASCTTSWVGDFVESDFTAACPSSSIIRYTFEKDNGSDLELNWYDGGLMPAFPEGIGEEESIGDDGGGSIFYGTKGIMIADTYSGNPRLLKQYEASLGQLPQKPKKSKEETHMDNWVNACLKGGETYSSFEQGAKLTEVALAGNLAIRSYQFRQLEEGKKPTDWAPFTYPGRRLLSWDASSGRIKNFEKANDWVNGSYREGWELPVTEAY